MNKILNSMAILAVYASVNLAQAATFTPNFTTPPFSGTQFNVDAAHNASYETNFGINVQNAYLYVDSRDTFDGIGVANGWVENIGSNQSGRINFLDSTDFVTFEYLAIKNTLYQAFSSADSLIDSFTANANSTGTESFNGGIISYILWTTDGGYGTISGLTYNYDGKTDGVNDDIPNVPVPGAIWLFGTGLMGFLGFNRVKRSAIQ